MTYKFQSPLFVSLLLGSAFAILALEPMLWLIRSWSSPDYDSAGALVFVLVVALFIWSFSSPLSLGQPAQARDAGLRLLPLCLLLATFGVRLASQLLDINLLGALMLSLDVFALGLLARLDERRRPVSPLLLAALFCFALPLEALLQRTIGFALQQLSASGACFVLSGFYGNASCEGVRILLDGVDVLVDLPCSGARVLILLLTTYFGLAALKSLSYYRSVVGLIFTCALAWMVNTFRIVALALGLRHESSTGINVMLDPWHSGIGLAASAIGILGLLLWLHFQPTSRASNWHSTRTDLISKSFLGVLAARLRSRMNRRWSTSVGLSVLAVFAACNVVSLKPQPLDVSAPLSTPELPLTLGGYAQQALPLSAQERTYFKTYGGSAARAGYGSSSLLMVRTTSPLRHFHTPDVCFAASGYSVTYVGADFSDTDFSEGPVAIYRSLSPEGEDLRVRVQFVSTQGVATHSISEVVWHWLREPTHSWTMVQTVTPWNAEAGDFLAAVGRSLNATTYVQQSI